MKYLLLIFFVIICNLAHGQIGMAINEIAKDGINGFQAQYRTVVIVVRSSNGKDTIQNIGCGFILKNEYLATCYHVYKNNPSYTPIQVKVYYNINSKHKPTNLIFLADSVFATLDYKPKRGQYNFKRHIYNGDMASDFIILRLLKKVKAVQANFDLGNILIGQDLLSTGLTVDRKGIDNIEYAKFWSSSGTVYSLDSLKGGNINIKTYGFVKHGYSGSPVFNKNGMIVGMVQEGIMPDKAKGEVKWLLSKSEITQPQSKLILKFLEDNTDGSLGYSTKINYLFYKYMGHYY